MCNLNAALYTSLFLQEKCTWRKDEDGVISKAFDSACSTRLSSMLSDARNNRGPKDEIRPDWIGEGTWRKLCEKWNTPEYQKKCAQNKANRRSEKAATSTHSVGSVNAATSSLRHEAQHGRLPTLLETFDYFHFKNGSPLDKRSESIDVSIILILIFLLYISINCFTIGVFMAFTVSFHSIILFGLLVFSLLRFYGFCFRAVQIFGLF